MTIQPLVLSGLAAIVAVSLTSAPVAAQSAAAPRSADLLRLDPPALVRFLDEIRPVPVTEAVRSRVLASLPTQGEIQTFDEGARRRLAALSTVLGAAKRSSVYSVKVVDVPYAFVGLHARTVLFISGPALRILSEDELRALVAHETGHEYVHAEYERATARGQSGRLQDLELVCDIIAVVTLHRIGQDAKALAAGVERITRFNHFQFGDEIDDPAYPNPLRRRTVAAALENRLRGGLQR